MEYIFIIKRILRIFSINFRRLYRSFIKFLKDLIVIFLVIFLIWFIVMTLGGMW